MSRFKEILVFEAIVFIGFWISNEYLAALLTFIAVPIFGGVLIISLIAEKIERSKISKDYFLLMIGLAIIPAIIFFIFHVINAGEYNWLESL
ncbi:MAG: hypothetical protein IPO92_04230 [Saprospiraceae bacterium]|nr:hypothetical protein [Saprospiraceae bacterium]